MKKILSCLLAVCLLWSCNEPVVVPIAKVTEKPVRADFISIDQQAYETIIKNLDAEAEVDSSLFNSQTALLITASPWDESSYLIHPPRIPFQKQVEVYARIEGGELQFELKCPFKHAYECNCLNNPESCLKPGEKGFAKTFLGCKTIIQVSKFFPTCSPLLCGTLPPSGTCKRTYLKINTSLGKPLTYIECKCF